MIYICDGTVQFKMNCDCQFMEQDFASMAALIGEPVRANILWLLTDGRAYTASELAAGTGTSPQNLSMHLSKLIKADLLKVEVQGRHRYYAFARPEVAYAVESLAGLLSAGAKEMITREDPPIRVCRTCYDHLAGKVGVQLTDSLIGQGLLERAEKEFCVTDKGERWFGQMGIDLVELRRQRRGLARVCIDWTERRPHLAGSLGAALLGKMLDEGWVRRMANTRAVLVTAKGRRAMGEYFKVAL
jgi:DNA-binding transcriptional ArsR family regulator/predicted transcriptional regulator